MEISWENESLLYSRPRPKVIVFDRQRQDLDQI